jgi:hypothetical protein
VRRRLLPVREVADDLRVELKLLRALRFDHLEPVAHDLVQLVLQTSHGPHVVPRAINRDDRGDGS